MSPDPGEARYVLCVSNEDYEASLVVRRVYQQLPDADAESHGLLRVVDESGEDYLFPKSLFASIVIPRTVSEKLAPTF
jgi:hypothetical protein